MHAIIERTATFIAQHGVQMEIMMKAKQKDNAHFSFLNYEDELNAYYKHILHAIKHSKYTPASVLQKTPAESKCHLVFQKSTESEKSGTYPKIRKYRRYYWYRQYFLLKYINIVSIFNNWYWPVSAPDHVVLFSAVFIFSFLLCFLLSWFRHLYD